MATAPLKRVKTSQAVVDHVHREIVEGRLRPGDRVDVEPISTALGISPTPVREALVLLERDGVVTTKVYRAAYIEHFDAHTLRADYHVFGLLSGVTVARLALQADPAVLARLEELLSRLRSARGHDRRHEVSAELLAFQHQEGGTPRLRAELRGFGGLLAYAARDSEQRSHEEIVAAHASVIEAVVAGDERGASQRRLAEARTLAEQVIEDWVRRGVLADDGTNRP